MCPAHVLLIHRPTQQNGTHSAKQNKKLTFEMLWTAYEFNARE